MINNDNTWVEKNKNMDFYLLAHKYEFVLKNGEIMLNNMFWGDKMQKVEERINVANKIFIKNNMYIEYGGEICQILYYG